MEINANTSKQIVRSNQSGDKSEKLLHTIKWAEKLGTKYNGLQDSIGVDVASIQCMCTVMNLGEDDPRLQAIYAKKETWTKEDRQEVRNHGQYSVDILTQFGTILRPEEKDAIIGHSRNEYPTPEAFVIKTAEVCAAMSFSRYTKEGPKKAAESFLQIAEVLKKEGIQQNFIDIASEVYEEFHIKGKRLQQEEEEADL